MSLKLQQIVFDSANAAELAGFWSVVFNRPVDPGANEFFATIGRGDEPMQPALMFIQVPEPRSGKNRQHLDLSAVDRDTEVSRLIAAGASHVGDFDEYGVSWTTLSDPEGNLFDVAAGHD